MIFLHKHGDKAREERDGSTLLLLKYLRSSVTTEFESSSKLCVVFCLCLILSFVSKFFQPFQPRKYFLGVLGCFSGPLHSEVRSLLCTVQGSCCPTQVPQAVLGVVGLHWCPRGLINGLHWLSCRELITFLGKVGFLQCLSQTNPVLPLCSRVLI